MSDPTKKQDFTNAFKEVFKRLRNLEGRGAFSNTSLQLPLSDGTAIEFFKSGELSDGTHGISIGKGFADLTTFQVSQEEGIVSPNLPAPFYKIEEFDIINDLVDHSFFATYQDVPIAYKGIRVRCRFDTGVDVTGNVWLSDGYTHTTSVWPLPIFTSTFVDFHWLHGAALGTNNQIFVHVQKTGGAGDIDVWNPRSIQWVGPSGCTVTGI